MCVLASRWWSHSKHSVQVTAASSVALAPGCCLHHPRAQQPQIREWQQKQCKLLGCAPDSRVAAKAPLVAWMCWTFLSCSCTWLLSPPFSGSPQVTTAPDSRTPAKAVRVAWMCWTVPQLLLHLAAVPTPAWITPGHNSPRFTNGSKCILSCLDVLDVP